MNIIYIYILWLVLHDWRCFWSSSRYICSRYNHHYRCRIASTLSMIFSRWSWVPLNINGWWLEVFPHWCGGFKVGSSWTPTGWYIQQKSPDLKSRIWEELLLIIPSQDFWDFFFCLGLFGGDRLQTSIFYKQFMYDFKMVTPNEFQHFLFNLLQKNSQKQFTT